MERIIVLVGTTGSGKTWKAVELARSLPRLFILNPTGLDEPKLESLGIAIEKMTDLVTYTQRTERFCLRLTTIDPDRIDFICQLAYSIGDCTILIDELSLYCTPHSMPLEFASVLRLGRHRGVNFIATTQRPTEVSTLYFALCREWYVFQTHLESDLQRLRHYIPDADRAINLKVGEYIQWFPGKENESGQ